MRYKAVPYKVGVDGVPDRKGTQLSRERLALGVMTFRRGAGSYAPAMLCMYGSGLDRVGCCVVSLDCVDIEYHPLFIDEDDTSILWPQKQRHRFIRLLNNAAISSFSLEKSLY